MQGRQIELKHLAKVFWPDTGRSKGDMLRYYRTVAPLILPYLRSRPLTLKVCPDGIAAGCYYRRKLPDYAPEWMPRALYNPKSRSGQVPLIQANDAAQLLWLANQAAIEFHVWSSRSGDLAHPDWLVLDLDPGARATFAEVLQAALFVADGLTELGLKGWPKTSGGRGLHVFVPLARGRYNHAQARAWVRSFSEGLVRNHAELLRLPHGATHEGWGVFIDYAQNGYGRNTAAPYTLRAKPGAPVSTPLRWSEVKSGGFLPHDFTLASAPERFVALGDLFAGVLSSQQELPQLSPMA